ncbi:MAG: DUF1566 domain-containing protein [Rhodoferax sp.]
MPQAFKLPTRLALGAALLLCLHLPAQAQPTGLLNDTGQTTCFNGSAMEACSYANTGDAATYKRQDGRFGRDVAGVTKVGGGAGGFDFTRICFNGGAQGSGTCTGSLVANTTGTASGSPGTDWACTKDNVTNLIWSLQSQAATWNAATVPTYPDAGHNSANRCGFSTGWRLPTRRELLSIVHNGLPDYSTAMVDVAYFPSTFANVYWTSDPYAPYPSGAWIVNFYYGHAFAYYKTGTYYVRLVRSGQ